MIHILFSPGDMQRTQAPNGNLHLNHRTTGGTNHPPDRTIPARSGRETIHIPDEATTRHGNSRLNRRTTPDTGLPLILAAPSAPHRAIPGNSTPSPGGSGNHNPSIMYRTWPSCPRRTGGPEVMG